VNEQAYINNNQSIDVSRCVYMSLITLFFSFWFNNLLHIYCHPIITPYTGDILVMEIQRGV